MKRRAWNYGLGRYGVGRTVNASGYILVRCPGHPGGTAHGYVYEHRLKMERKLGRRLRRGEVVHHRNGVKSDNRLINLELITAADHMRHHARATGGLRAKCRARVGDVLRLFKRGVLMKDISRRVGLSHPTVRKIVVAHGFIIPNPSRSMKAVRRYWRKMGIE